MNTKDKIQKKNNKVFKEVFYSLNDFPLNSRGALSCAFMTL